MVSRRFAFPLCPSTVDVCTVPTVRELFPQECVRWPSSTQRNVTFWSVPVPQPPHTKNPVQARRLRCDSYWHEQGGATKPGADSIRVTFFFLSQYIQTLPIALESKQMDREVIGITLRWTPPTLSAASTFTPPAAAVCLFLHSGHSFSHTAAVCSDRKTLPVQSYLIPSLKAANVRTFLEY